ncbi:MAG: hypothetical protein KAH77_09325 [Thiomargarita sp.]|nr:hypothetical protein [Thiomargarita sp.]
MKITTIKRAATDLNVSKTTIYNRLKTSAALGDTSETGNFKVDQDTMPKGVTSYNHNGGARKILDEDGYVQISKAAQKTGYTPQFIYYLIRDKGVRAKASELRRGKRNKLVNIADILLYKKNKIFGY